MKGAVVVDFDGTLITKNSFEEFYKFLGAWALLHFDIPLMVFLVWQILFRKSKRISHEELKRRLLSRICNYPNVNHIVSVFIKRLSGFVDMKVLALVKDYVRMGYIPVLSSAAPALYVMPFTRCYHDFFVHVLATENPTGDGWKENIGEAKAARTMAKLRDLGLNLAVLITDSSDDLPLLRIGKEKNWLVRPSERARDEIDAAGIIVGVLK